MTISTRVETDDLNPNKHIVLPAAGGNEYLGVVFDEQGTIPSRGRYAVWSPKASARNGTVGFYDTLDEAVDAIRQLYDAPAPEGKQPDSEPAWQTLKGVTAPFRVYGEQSGGRVCLARDRKMPTGGPIEVVRLETRGGCRYGYTADGLRIDFVGLATKCWVIAGPAN
ncbi:MAG TPA: hypothetical protein DD420_21820 [Streptomyces sp.]|nr:hypothetical protein [Streptomyces sp.]